jgi:hypothetical protein
MRPQPRRPTGASEGLNGQTIDCSPLSMTLLLDNDDVRRVLRMRDAMAAL